MFHDDIITIFNQPLKKKLNLNDLRRQLKAYYTFIYIPYNYIKESGTVCNLWN